MSNKTERRLSKIEIKRGYRAATSPLIQQLNARIVRVLQRNAKLRAGLKSADTDTRIQCECQLVFLVANDGTDVEPIDRGDLEPPSGETIDIHANGIDTGDNSLANHAAVPPTTDADERPTVGQGPFNRHRRFSH